MDPRLRSTLTLLVLGGLLASATLWGWRAATKPVPGLSEVEACVDTDLAAGTELFPDQVAVSVFNAGQRNGLATKTMNKLISRGFVGVDTGNAPEGTAVAGVQIYGRATSPAVQLVQAQFRDAQVTVGPALGLGVVVVVGDDFKSLLSAKRAPTSLLVAEASTICSPPGSGS